MTKVYHYHGLSEIVVIKTSKQGGYIHYIYDYQLSAASNCGPTIEKYSLRCYSMGPTNNTMDPIKIYIYMFLNLYTCDCVVILTNTIQC